jgi:metallophosphoesterase superfamily enzyme
MSGQLELAPGKLAHPSGALWLVESGVLLVAGAHLGYGWAQHRRPDPPSVFDGGAHKRLGRLVEELKPKKLVLLGDPAQAPNPAREWAGAFGRLRPLLVNEWRQDDVVALYGSLPKTPVPGGHILVFGHLRPFATIDDRTGVRRRLPAFLRSRRAIVLPAFSPFSGGIDVTRGIPGELRELLGRGPVQVALTTGRRVVPLKLPGGG